MIYPLSKSVCWPENCMEKVLILWGEAGAVNLSAGKRLKGTRRLGHYRWPESALWLTKTSLSSFRLVRWFYFNTFLPPPQPRSRSPVGSLSHSLYLPLYRFKRPRRSLSRDCVDCRGHEKGAGSPELGSSFNVCSIVISA